jgi:putative ABC transport system permease protein
MEIRALLSAMGRSKTGPLLVAAQVALTLAVIVNVAYVIQQRLSDAGKPTGLDLGNMFWVSTQASSPDYNYPAAVKADMAYLNSLPGVVAATVISVLPQTFSSSDLPFATNPQTLNTPEGGVDGTLYMGTDKLIDALGLKLVAGRNFAPEVIQQPAPDMGASFARWAPEIIVTRAMAKKLFPDGPDAQALGKTVYTGLINKSAVIVGVVDLMRANPVAAQYDQFATQIVLLPIIPAGPDADYVIRTAPGRRDELMARIDKEFAELQPGRFINRMEAYDHTAFKARANYRATIIILGVAAFFVLLVTVIGIVGLAAFNVASRTKQLGTRRAIGARKYHILRYFLVENWLTTTGGVVLGCILALAAGVQLSSMFQMPRLPLYYLVGGVLLLWIVGLVSVLVPALRAASISPAVATRTV